MKKFYSTETEKALHSFGRGETPPVLVRAYGEVKKAALLAQQECYSLYDENHFPSIIEALDEIIAGKHREQFPLPLEQGGAGTSLHMNINEVIAGLANEKNKDSLTIDSLEALARFQSTNDTLSTAVTIMVYRQLEEAEALVIKLQEILVLKESEFDPVLMTGRTELQDALPISLGQIFASWAGAIERDRWRLHKLKERLRTIALGGTALGTCFSAPRKYVFTAEKHLRQITGLPICRSQNLVDEISNCDILAEVAAGFELVSLNLRKMASDLLLYTSSFCGELIHPELQYGSTIMPFKTNPVLLEYLKGLCLSIKHECHKIADYAAEGQLQLNPFMPFMAKAFISLREMLHKALNVFTEKFFPFVKVDRQRIEQNLLSSPALINTLRQVIAYGKVKELVPLIQQNNPQTLVEIKQIIAENTPLTIEFLNEWFDRSKLTNYTEIEGRRQKWQAL